MQCPQQDGSSAEVMTAYAAGTLEPQAQIDLERHLAACEACREMAARQKTVWEALGEWKPEPVSPDFDDRVYRRIAEEEAAAWWQRPFRRNWSWFWRPAMPLAAACAALLVAFLLKEPQAPHHALQQQVSIEQVERALDDMDLLKQLSAPAPAAGHSTGRI